MRGLFGFALFCVAAFAAFVALTNLVVIGTTQDDIVSEEDAAAREPDAILVLGASVFADGTPSGILQDRLNETARLYFAGAASRIIVSGDGRQTSYNEPAAMKDYLIGIGVPSEAIFCDRAGYSTYDSTYRARYIFGCKTLVVVTQSYHLTRAVYSARGLGIDAIGVASDGGPYAKQNYYDVREIGARSKDFVYTLIKKRSAILGEPVSLEQSGDVTNDQRVSNTL
mgnify:CR=1 FL=1